MQFLLLLLLATSLPCYSKTQAFDDLYKLELGHNELEGLKTSIDNINWKSCSSESCVGQFFKSTSEVEDFQTIVRENSKRADLADHINIFMGTNNEGPKFSRGNQHPGVHVPFGMNAFSVTTKNPSNPWFYQYDEMNITGIKLTHQPSVWASDHASMVFLPANKLAAKKFLDLSSPYRKSKEIAKAYYYKNTLLSSGIDFEFSPSNRGVHFQIDYKKSKHKSFNIWSKNKRKSDIRKIDNYSVQGHINNNDLKMYYYLQTSSKISSITKSKGNDAINFASMASSKIGIKIATSFISAEQAKANFILELEAKNFSDTKKMAKKSWNDLLGRIKVSGGSLDSRVSFYSSIYRLHAFPKTFWEHVGTDTEKSQYFSPYDNKVHKGKLWSGNGFWDTYRAVWPFFTILHPTLTGEMLDGWLNSYKDGGWMVRWSNPGYWQCMISTHSDIIFADAMVKGIEFDHKLAYKASLKNALTAAGFDGKGRRFLEDYNFKGFVPWYGKKSDDEVGARTIEHAYNDFGLYQMSKKLASREKADYFKNRAHSYQNLWDPKSRHYRARKTNTQWRTSEANFNPYSWRYAWTEGNAWHYRTPAPFDIEAMTNLYGTRDDLESIIDGVMSASSKFDPGGYGREIHEMTEAKAIGDKGFGQFAIGNQPIQHMLHMYNFTSRPDKAQYWVKRSLRELFSSGFTNGHGYPGDEDNGQTSAWYVMNAIGLYSASPGIAEYSLTSGIFKKLELTLEDSRVFTIENDSDSSEDIYITSAELNGKIYHKNYIKHSDIMAGGSLRFELSQIASEFASKKSEQASSMSGEDSNKTYQNDALKGLQLQINGEEISSLTDDSSSTAKLLLEGINEIFIDTQKSDKLDLYTITSGNKLAARTSISWKLLASNDKSEWALVDERNKESWSDPKQTRLFEIDSKKSYRYLKLILTNSEQLEISEIELYSY